MSIAIDQLPTKLKEQWEGMKKSASETSEAVGCKCEYSISDLKVLVNMKRIPDKDKDETKSGCFIGNRYRDIAEVEITGKPSVIGTKEKVIKIVSAFCRTKTHGLSDGFLFNELTIDGKGIKIWCRDEEVDY